MNKIFYLFLKRGGKFIKAEVKKIKQINYNQTEIFTEEKNYKYEKTVLASDGFFPFPDIIKICSKNNIASIIQPGGSKNDQMVIKAANKSNISMTFTGIRHFKH